MADFPEQAQPQSPLTGLENILAAKTAAGGAIMIYITPAQLKEYIGTGVPENFFDGANKVNVSFMPTQKLSNTQFQQLKVGNVLQDIEHNMDWFNAAVRAVGTSEGWGTGTPGTQLAAAVISLETVTENSISFSWPAVVNAATYEIYRGGLKIATISATSYTSVGLTASTQYAHYVRSVPAAGTSYITGPASNTLTASTSAASGTPLLTTPTLSVSSKTDTSVVLDWSNSVSQNGAGAVNNYTVVLSLTSDFASTVGVFNGLGNTATANGLTPNTKYFFRVRAGNGTIFSGYGLVEATTEQSTAPSLTKMPAPLVNSGGLQLPFTSAEPAITASSNLQNVFVKWGLYFVTGQDTDIVIVAKGHRMGFALHNKTDNFVNQTTVTFSYNPNNGKVEASIGNTGVTLVQDFYGDPYYKLTSRKATSDILFQWSADGNTWSSGQAISISDGITLYFRINAYGLATGDNLSLMYYSGLLTDNTVS